MVVQTLVFIVIGVLALGSLWLMCWLIAKGEEPKKRLILSLRYVGRFLLVVVVFMAVIIGLHMIAYALDLVPPLLPRVTMTPPPSLPPFLP